MQGRVTLPRAQKLISQKLKNKDVRCAGKNPCTCCQKKTLKGGTGINLYQEGGRGWGVTR